MLAIASARTAETKNRQLVSGELFPPAQPISVRPHIEGWFDGGCWPNPGGHAAWGAVLKIDGATVKRWNGYLGTGRTSNNVAEYAGLCALLKEIAQHPGPGVVFGDSLMVIRQMQKRKLAKSDGIYVPWNHEAIRLLEPLRDRVTFEWIPREENTACDMLAEQVLDRALHPVH